MEGILVESRCRGGSHFAPVFELTTNSQAEEYTGFINRTSGSTGSMKSVLVSHAHFIATMEATRLTVPSTTNPDEDAKEDMERYAGERLTGLQCLSSGVRCIDQIPVTGFKINQRVLRNMA
ncbi:AMP-dependent synthetase/ligase [Penicillium verrucosum]|uniref:AMP-dependent synthetase/ligase n=1 Tax=Penicillium verrucosum TaxID=60171 RepID=UPI002544ED22|nr:AMP-dependent synthetase/ligase [Penicillium verrucosum]KAJ5927318.1 AMP-dependent synthetase/ligase [Penicillium verrucosum]